MTKQKPLELDPNVDFEYMLPNIPYSFIVTESNTEDYKKYEHQVFQEHTAKIQAAGKKYGHGSKQERSILGNFEWLEPREEYEKNMAYLRY